MALCHGGNGTDPTRNASYRMTIVRVAMVATTHSSIVSYLHTPLAYLFLDVTTFTYPFDILHKPICRLYCGTKYNNCLFKNIRLFNMI